MNLNRLLLSLVFCCILPLLSIAQVFERTDTLFIPEISQVPVIDGSAADEVWQEAGWQNIGEVWMPYNNLSSNLDDAEGLQLWGDENDFSGRYKVLWSMQTNRLYVIAEIKDDVFVDGYTYNENPSSGGGYFNYDILEVFIDEDRSGGLHVFDGTGSVANSWGSNAENAFSYHLALDAPDDGEVQQQFHALDIAGTTWGYPNQKVADYTGHFSAFALKKEDNLYTWEFALEVHGQNYTHSNPDASVVSLEEGKIFGLSFAYCDNDNPDESPLMRDNFFGSVYVPAEAYNDHWMNANWFGVAKLSGNPATFSFDITSERKIIMNSSFINGKLHVSVRSASEGEVNVRVLNILGREMYRETLYKPSGAWSNHADFSGWQHGVYLVEIIHGSKRSTQKIIIH